MWEGIVLSLRFLLQNKLYYGRVGVVSNYRNRIRRVPLIHAGLRALCSG